MIFKKSKAGRSPQIHLALPEELKAQIEARAALEQRSVANLIRKIIIEYLNCK